MVPKTLSQKTKLIPKRARELNVIYFLDSNKTKSFKISMVQLRLLIASVVLIGLWSLSSFTFLSLQISKSSKLEKRLQVAMGHVFEYQTRFEGVYDKAYPADKFNAPLSTDTSPKVAALSPKTSKDALKSAAGESENSLDAMAEGVDDSIPDDSVESEESSSTTNVTAKVERSITVGANQGAVASSGPSVKIDSPSMQTEQGKLSFRFSLKNVDKNAKAEGVLFGIAKFESPDGSVTYVGAPHNVRPDTEGIALQPNEGFRFGIMFHKSKKLTFAPPTAKPGTFSEVRIYVLKTKGGDFDTFFTVDDKVRKQIANLVAAAPAVSAKDKESDEAPQMAPSISNTPDIVKSSDANKKVSYADDADIEGE